MDTPSIDSLRKCRAARFPMFFSLSSLFTFYPFKVPPDSPRKQHHVHCRAQQLSRPHVHPYCVFFFTASAALPTHLPPSPAQNTSFKPRGSRNLHSLSHSRDVPRWRRACGPQHPTHSPHHTSTLKAQPSKHSRRRLPLRPHDRASVATSPSRVDSKKPKHHPPKKKKKRTSAHTFLNRCSQRVTQPTTTQLAHALPTVPLQDTAHS